jgi:hypothetical protein
VAICVTIDRPSRDDDFFPKFPFSKSFVLATVGALGRVVDFFHQNAREKIGRMSASCVDFVPRCVRT